MEPKQFPTPPDRLCGNSVVVEVEDSPDEAAAMAGYRRFRPVLMTTLTTVLGLLPMAAGLGEGAELYSPMALSILGGLSISTVFTLVVVPVAYAAIRKKFPLKLYEESDDEKVKVAIGEKS